MYVLCVSIPHYALALARREAPDIAAEIPAVLADKPDRGRVIAADDRARASGARTGQTVLQARAVAFDAHVFVHDAQRSRAVWSDMLDALDAITPIVEDACEGIAYLDMRGINGSAEQWMERAYQALQPFQLPLQTSVGPNKFVARAAAFENDRNVWTERDARRNLAPLPLDLLDIAPKTMDRLHLLGIKTLGDLARLPHGPFVRRFGGQAARTRTADRCVAVW